MKNVKGKNGFYEIKDLYSSSNCKFYKHYTHKKDKCRALRKSIKALFNPSNNKIMIMKNDILLIFIDGDFKTFNRIGKYVSKFDNDLKETLVKNNIILADNFIQTTSSFVIQGYRNEGYTHFLGIPINDIKLLQLVF